jgi:transglutaminase-like putative cysteine protease
VVIRPAGGDSSGVRYEEVERQRIVPLNGRGVSRYRTITSSYRRGLDTVEVVRAEIRHWRPGRGDEPATVTHRPHAGLADAGRLEASLRQQVLSFGGIERLDTLVVHTRRLIRRLPLADAWSYTFFAGGRDSVASWRFSVTRPAGTPLLTELHGVPPPEAAGRGNWEKLVWSGGPVGPVPPLPMTPHVRERVDRVVVATSPPEEVSRLLWPAFSGALEAQAPAGTVEQAGSTPAEMRRWVASRVDYLGADWGLSPGYSPKPPRETMECRAGVCRDKAVLLAWLLRGLGMEATVGLTSVVSQPDGLVGARSFDHVVTLLRSEGEWQVLDPTFEGFGPCSYSLRGRRVLPLLPGGEGFCRVPRTGDDTMHVSIRGELSGGAVRGTVRCRARGGAGEVLRAVCRATPEGDRPRVLALLLGADPDSSSLRCSAPDSIDTPMTLEGRGLWRAKSLEEGGSRLTVLPGLFGTDRILGHQLAYSMVEGYLSDTLLPDPPVTLVLSLSVLTGAVPRNGPVERSAGIYSSLIRSDGDTLRMLEAVDLSRPSSRTDAARAALLCRDAAPRTVMHR